MLALPQLIEEDMQVLDGALQDLLAKSDASVVLLLDQAGFLLSKAGEVEQFDTVTIGALAANAFAATQAMAGLVQETQFNCLYQQGASYSVVVMNIEETCLLAVIFRAGLSVGAIRYYAARTIDAIKSQLRAAYLRTPGMSLDLSSANLADPSSLLRKAQTP